MFHRVAEKAHFVRKSWGLKYSQDGGEVNANSGDIFLDNTPESLDASKSVGYIPDQKWKSSVSFRRSSHEPR